MCLKTNRYYLLDSSFSRHTTYQTSCITIAIICTDLLLNSHSLIVTHLFVHRITTIESFSNLNSFQMFSTKLIVFCHSITFITINVCVQSSVPYLQLFVNRCVYLFLQYLIEEQTNCFRYEMTISAALVFCASQFCPYFSFTECLILSKIGSTFRKCTEVKNCRILSANQLF
jgi:hypothetical protein